jgi:hypothetical protein
VEEQVVGLCALVGARLAGLAVAAELVVVDIRRGTPRRRARKVRAERKPAGQWASLSFEQRFCTRVSLVVQTL